VTPPSDHILFVTGRLAEPSLQELLAQLAPKLGWTFEVAVIGVNVAALMNTKLVRKRLAERFTKEALETFTRIILPGWCGGETTDLQADWNISVERGPKDLFDLPEFFGLKGKQPPPLDRYSIQILAEINHAPRLSQAELLKAAAAYRESGADTIDLGCIPSETWKTVRESTALLVAEGFRVSIDTFNQQEAEEAVAGGAELLLSCNSTNIDWCAHLGCEVVLIPDNPHDFQAWEPNRQRLQAAGVKYRLDPILEPIGFGFAASIARYMQTRATYPNDPIMMGIGNLTELTEVDSAGLNFCLAAICEELQIGSVLATEVINWGRSAVKEFDIARRMVHHSIKHGVLPKHWGGQLTMLRDPKLTQRGQQQLTSFANQITDPNFRIFAERGEIHLMNRDGYWHGPDPYAVFDEMQRICERLSPEHAFYLGYELSKAKTALTLGKQYIQDEALRWGFLVEAETSALERRREYDQQLCGPRGVAAASANTSDQGSRPQ
jgi:dihydropteroate synthase